MFALHFEDGLSDNDPQTYSFSRRGQRYAVSTVIQYDQNIKHFVTWTRAADGGRLFTVLVLLLLLSFTDPSDIHVCTSDLFL